MKRLAFGKAADGPIWSGRTCAGRAASGPSHLPQSFMTWNGCSWPRRPPSWP